MVKLRIITAKKITYTHANNTRALHVLGINEFSFARNIKVSFGCRVANLTMIDFSPGKKVFLAKESFNFLYVVVHLMQMF